MKRCCLWDWFGAAIVFILASLNPDPLSAQGTAFTYQGRLLVNSNAASGNYDMQFKLHFAAPSTNLAGPILTNLVGVTNGLFLTTLDFGNVFDGTALYLEIGVRAAGSSSNFTVLNPAQPLNPTPYAVHAASANAYTGPVAFSNASGNFNGGLSGTFNGAATGTFTGNGAGLTNLNLSGPNLVPPGATYDNGTSAFDLSNQEVTSYGPIAMIPGATYKVVLGTNDRFFINADESVFASRSLFTPVDNQMYLLGRATNTPVTAQIYLCSTNVAVLNGLFSGFLTNISMLGSSDFIQLWGGYTGGETGNALIWGDLTDPTATNKANIYLNLGHGGFGNGSEFTFTANNFAFIGKQGVALTPMYLQFGGQAAQGPNSFILQYYGGGITSGNLTNLSSTVDFRSGYWNGTNAVGLDTCIGVSRIDASTGISTLTVFDPQSGLGNPVALSYSGPHRQDYIGNIGVKNYGAGILDATNVTPGPAYSVNFGMAVQNLIITQATTISFTNYSFINNTAASTRSALFTDVYLFASNSQALTFSVPAPFNLIWESDAGFATAPASIPSGMLHLHFLLDVANGKTNLIAHATK